MKVVAGPVKLKVGRPLASKPLNVSGDVADAVATFLTPQSELSRFAKFSTSRLSCKV